MVVEVDDVLKSLGKWGKFQVLFYILLSIANTFPASWHMLAIVFIGGQQETRCALDDGLSPEYHIPKAADGKLEKCVMYKDINVNNETIDCPNGYFYSGEAGPTIVDEWDLVCDRSYLVETTQTVMVIGVMVGAMGFSAMSDYLGRKPVFLFSEWAMVVVGISTAFVTNYYVFSALRFCAGALQQGIILTGFVMACELFPAEQRTFAGMAIENFWATGMCLLAVFAYFIRNWRHLQLLISIPGVLSVAFFWFLPESVPWLAANHRIEEAEAVLKRAAKFNGVKISQYPLRGEEGDHILKEGETPPEEPKKGFLARLRPQKKVPKKTESGEEHKEEARYTLLDVLKHPKLRIYAIIMCALWFVNSLVYYGLSLSTSALAGDRYINFFLSGLVEIPAYTSCLFILQKWGRRWPLAIFHIIAGVALCVSLIIPEKTAGGTSLVPLIMSFNMIGKFGITGSFGTVFLYAPEIFPTTLRNQAMGISSLGGRLGNMLAPFASLVARIVPWLPGVLFGASSIAVGMLCLLLPETLNKPLPQTIEDIEAWSEPKKKKDKKDKKTADAIELGNDVKEFNATTESV